MLWKFVKLHFLPTTRTVVVCTTKDRLREVNGGHREHHSQSAIAAHVEDWAKNKAQLLKDNLDKQQQ